MRDLRPPIPIAGATQGDRRHSSGRARHLSADGLPARVELVENLGDTAVLDLDCAGARLRMRVSHGELPREGDILTVTARPQDIHLFDPETGIKRL